VLSSATRQRHYTCIRRFHFLQLETDEVSTIRKLLFFGILLLVNLGAASAPNLLAQEPLDGRNRVFRDELINNLAGDWKLTRKIRGQSVENSVKAEWVLSHQFLRVHMKDAGSPPSYETLVFIGYDNASERYVAHWLDIFGGRFSETLGYGTRSGNSIKFVFEYADGPFHNTFTWNPETKTWIFLMEQKDQAGKWKVFAEDTLRRL
jgi:hypothetical protein